MNLWLLYNTSYTYKNDYYEFVITIHHFNILIKTTTMNVWLLNTPLYILIKRLLWICDYYTPLNILIKTTTMNLWLLYTTLYTNKNEHYEFVITIQHFIYL